jgi:hypothetical protein
MIRHAVSLYRFTLSYRDVETLLAEGGGCLARDPAAVSLEVPVGVRPRTCTLRPVADLAVNRRRALALTYMWNGPIGKIAGCERAVALDVDGL